MGAAEFVLARLDEREAAARACPPWPWRVATVEDEANNRDEQTYTGETVVAADGSAVATPWALSGPQARAVRDHIAYHDPARVLADCDTMRSIVAEHQPRGGFNQHSEFGPCCGTCASEDNAGDLNGEWPCATLRALAAIWSDHPDFDPGWRRS